MATLTSNKCSAGVQPHGVRVGLVSTTAVFSANGSLSSGDVVQMIKVPQGAQLTHIWTAYNLSGVGSFTIGDGVSAARYLAATVGSSGVGPFTDNNLPQNMVPYTYSTDDTIDVTLSFSTNASSGAIYMIAVVNLDP